MKNYDSKYEIDVCHSIKTNQDFSVLFSLFGMYVPLKHWYLPYKLCGIIPEDHGCKI